MSVTFSRFIRAAVLAPAFILAACSDDPVRIDDHDHGGEVEAVRIHLFHAGVPEVPQDLEPSVTPHDLILHVGDNTIHVEWLDHDGDVISGLDHDFRLELENLPGGITFTPTSAFTGTLTVTEPMGTGVSLIELFHIEEGHGDFSVSVSFVLAT